jgi:N6-L-threonylcarbamoyladenine synthase
MVSKMSIIIAVESSCDDTSVAFMDVSGRLIDVRLVSQAKIHAQFGGVVPEVASRNHTINLQKMFLEMMEQNSIFLQNIVAVCATGGPGLLGGLIVGLMFAKGLAIALDIPFIAVNHLEGHLMSGKIENPQFQPPFLALLVSGGNCMLVAARALGDYVLFGQTLDDAAGEAFDKTARMMGIEYPGGAMIESLAREGGDVYKLTIPMRGKTVDMSFSGLKTNVSMLIKKIMQEKGGALRHQDMCDVAFAVQKTITKSLQEKLTLAVKHYIRTFPDAQRVFTLCGGVAANENIRNMCRDVCDKHGFEFVLPSLKYCTDNAAMIATVGLEYFKLGRFSDLGFVAAARWDIF